jgi:hypothetical protein
MDPRFGKMPRQKLNSGRCQEHISYLTQLAHKYALHRVRIEKVGGAALWPGRFLLNCSVHIIM